MRSSDGSRPNGEGGGITEVMVKFLKIVFVIAISGSIGILAARGLRYRYDQTRVLSPALRGVCAFKPCLTRIDRFSGGMDVFDPVSHRWLVVE